MKTGLLEKKLYKYLPFVMLVPLSKAIMPIDLIEPTLADRVCALEQSLFAKYAGKPKQHTVHPPLGNPSPLGLLGFASASILSAVMKITSDKTAQASGTFAVTAIFLGGFAQILASIFHVLQNHTHAATSFGLYAFHWIAVGFQIWVRSIQSEEFVNDNPLATATYSGVLAVMTLFLWIPTVRMNAVLSSLFLALILVFVTEIPAAYGTRAAEVASGIIQGIAGGIGAYLAVLDLVNETWRRSVLPLFAHEQHREDYAGKLDDEYIPKQVYYKNACSSIHL